MRRLVCVAVIALLSGTPAFAAVCAELCGLKTASTAGSPHCSTHATAHTRDIGATSAPAHHVMPAAARHRSDHSAWHPGDGEGLAISVGHRPDCCGASTLTVAVPAKPSKADDIPHAAVAPSQPYVALTNASAGLRVPPPGSSQLRAPSRAPLVLRI
jgi:hypothetical protein